MRKIVVGLMLLLPILFVLAVFTSIKTVSLSIPVSAGGIEIVERPESDALFFDLSEYENDYVLKANVTPDGARNRGYFFRVEGDDCIEADEDGRLIAKGVGEARIFAVSKDGGYEDGIGVVVYSSKASDFSLSLLSSSGDEVQLFEETDGYHAEISTGLYRIRTQVMPAGVLPDTEIEVLDGAAKVDRDSLLLPFSGQTVIKISAKSRLGGRDILLEKKLILELKRAQTASGIVVNGGVNALVSERESDELTFYLEGEDPRVENSPFFRDCTLSELFPGKYLAKLTFGEKRGDFVLKIVGKGGQAEEVRVTFSDFDFSIRSNLPVQTGDTAEVLVGVPVLFYAVPSVSATGITYEWRADGGEFETCKDGAECRFFAGAEGEFRLSVRALRRGVPLDVYERSIGITAVGKVTAARFALEKSGGLGSGLVIGGLSCEGEETVPNAFLLPLVCYDGDRIVEAQMKLRSSDENIARIEDGKLIPTGTGKVTVTAEWAGNPSFGTHIFTKAEICVVKDAVEVKTAPALFRMAKTGAPIVLMRDILLGTDEGGEPLPSAEREKLLGSMPSTYNTEFYKNRNKSANVRYVLEFCGNVYGNGHTLNAQLFSAERDASGQPRFFMGPLDFVSFGELASVAAQDNICYLIRTDGVTLYDLTLLGCGDDLLKGEEGYDLSALDLTGTTLEINADSKIVNCRVRNGRTVVRVYGGNRDGEGYFTERPEVLGDRASRERIRVTIDGCILSQGREFVLKIGANAALSSNAEERAPALIAKSGEEYPLKTNAFDKEFYENYVFTDVTLKDSVLERSGFFTIGMESNFSGELLQKGAESGALNFEGWNGTGGTSFASVLRLEGDVRLYDWKELRLIDSSTLIKTELPELKLDIAAMLGYVAEKQSDIYGEVLDDGYVHGGIAFYGGGKNYSKLETGNLSPDRADFGEYFVNIRVLEGAEGSTGYLGRILPSAAGTEDFRFYLYGKSGKNSKSVQEEEESSGRKYEGVRPTEPDKILSGD